MVNREVTFRHVSGPDATINRLKRERRLDKLKGISRRQLKKLPRNTPRKSGKTLWVGEFYLRKKAPLSQRWRNRRTGLIVSSPPR